MNELLSEVRTTKTAAQAPLDANIKTSRGHSHEIVKSLEDVLDILRNQPDLAAFEIVIKSLHDCQEWSKSVKQPSAKTTQILAALINDVLPNYWLELRNNNDSLIRLIISLLTSVPALGALINSLRVISNEASKQTAKSQASFLESRISCLIGLIEGLLSGDDSLPKLWHGIDSSDASATQKILLYKEVSALLASGKVISTISQAEDQIKHQKKSWLGNGRDYTRWLARNLAALDSIGLRSSENGKVFIQMFAKALSIGYTEIFLETLITCLATTRSTTSSTDGLESLISLIARLRAFEQRSIFTIIVRLLDSKLSYNNIAKGAEQVSRVASLLRALTMDNENLSECLLDILTRPEANTWIVSLAILTAGAAALSNDRTAMETILDRVSEKFSDDLFIQHAPIVHQENAARVLLLVAGIIQRKQPLRLRTYAKSSRFMNSISQHLSCNSARVRWLGMVVGSAVSELVDGPDNRLKFDDDSLKTSDAQEYMKLIRLNVAVSDKANLTYFFPSKNADLKDQPQLIQDLQIRSKAKHQNTSTNPLQSVSQVQKLIGPRIIELLDDGDESNADDDLGSYAKPESDSEDDDEDPTLVNRDRPKPPVYIRDLMSGLRDTENYDQHRMALTTAASLIRRKAGFGKEVKDHISELSTILMNLNNSFEFVDFVELREEALIAILIADPVPVSQYYAKSAFEGDFSIQQRTSILAAMGLGARELAAFKDDERSEAPDFPSKELPEHLKRIYGEKQTSLARIAVRVKQTINEPLTLKAADELAGPNALKVRTFSSRIAKEKTRRRPAANELAKIVGEGFFFPLTARWWTHARSAAPRNTASPFASPILLPVYLRTLALVLHAAGPWALALPQMTGEYWSILLAIRGAALGGREYGVLEAVLFGMLILLEINGEDKERVARERPRELLETQEWCKNVLGEISGGDKESEGIRGLAASVTMRCQDVIERWQRLMVGDMINY